MKYVNGNVNTCNFCNYPEQVIEGKDFSLKDAVLDTLRITLDAISIGGGINLAIEPTS